MLATVSGRRFPAGKLRRRPPAEAGSALVEFGLIFIVFMTIVMGINGFGSALYAYHFVSHAAREATRYAVVRGSTCYTDDQSCVASNSASGITGPTTKADVQAFVKQYAPSGIDTSKISFPLICGVSDGGKCAASPASCTTANAPGCTVSVTVSYNYNYIFPLLPSGALTLSSTSEMVIAH
jgi:Flp pilus assembly protein TadG